MSERPSAFGPTLKSIRTDLGLSQEHLAAALASTQRHVSFLETGRSQPTRSFLGRLCRELNLNLGQRHTLYEASGFASPYRKRDFSSEEVTRTLDMIEGRVLANWPFPAMVLDPEWTVLRHNPAAGRMLTALAPSSNAPFNLLELMLSPPFVAMVQNWEDASLTFYFRLQSAAAKSEKVAQVFAEAKARGIFDHMGALLQSPIEIDVFVPVEVALPGGAMVRMTSLLGQLVAVQDALVEGFEIEMMIPVDKPSEDLLRLAFG